MIGTIVNTCTIVAGTLIGVALHKGIKEKYKNVLYDNVLYDALGLACFAIGLNAVVTNLPKSQYPVLFIAAMAIGSVVGVALDIDGRFHRLVDRKSKQGEQRASGTRLADGLATATLVYCIGPLSMLGPVISAANLRLANISLAYNLPGSCLRNIGLSSARLQFNVENAVTFAKSTTAKYLLGGYNAPNYVFGLYLDF